MHLPVSQGHLLSAVKGMPAVGNPAVQGLVIPPCHEVRPRPCCARAHCRHLRELQTQSTSPLTPREGVGTSFVNHAELLRARGQGFPPPQSVQRNMLNICKGREIRWNRAREGWLSVDLFEGCTALLPQGGRKKAPWDIMCTGSCLLCPGF